MALLDQLRSFTSRIPGPIGFATRAAESVGGLISDLRNPSGQTAPQIFQNAATRLAPRDVQPVIRRVTQNVLPAIGRGAVNLSRDIEAEQARLIARNRPAQARFEPYRRGVQAASELIGVAPVGRFVQEAGRNIANPLSNMRFRDQPIERTSLVGRTLLGRNQPGAFSIAGEAGRSAANEANPLKAAGKLGLGIGFAGLEAAPGFGGGAKKEGAEGVFKAFSRISDDAGRLRPIVRDGLAAINQNDIVQALGRAKKVDDASVLIRQGDRLRIVPESRLGALVEKGAEAVIPMREAAQNLGFKNVSEYADEVRGFQRATKEAGLVKSQFESSLRERGNLPAPVRENLDMGLREVAPIRAAVDTAKEAIDDPFKAVATFGKEGKESSYDLLVRTLATSEKLSEAYRAGDQAALDALTDLFSKVDVRAAATEGGRILRLTQEFLSRSPQGLLFQAEALLKKANDELLSRGKPAVAFSDLDKAELGNLGRIIQEAGEGSPEAARALARAQNLVRRLVPLDLVSEALPAWFRTSILSSPATGLQNIIGAVSGLTVEPLARGIRRGVVSPLTRLATGVSGTGERGIMSGIKAGGKGLANSIQDVVEGTNTFTGAEKLGLGGKTFVRPEEIKSFKDIGKTGLDYTERAVGFMVSSADAVVRESVKANALREARDTAKRFFGADINDPAVARALEDMAEIEADMRTFTNEGVLSELFSGIQKAIGRSAEKTDSQALKKTLKFISNTVIPFVRVPPNLVTRGVVDYTPLGFAKSVAALSRFAKARKAGDVMGQLKNIRNFEDSASRAIAGSTIMSLGWIASEYDLMTSGAPTGEKERDLYRSLGIPDYGVNTSAIKRVITKALSAPPSERDSLPEILKKEGAFRSGDAWISYDSIQPIAIPIAAVGAVNKVAKDNPNLGVGEFLTEAFNGGVKSIISRPLFRNIKDLGTLERDPFNSLVSQAGNIATGLLTPGALSFIAQSMDDYVRETYSKDPLERVWNQFKARIPLIRESLPVRRTLEGDPVKNVGSISRVLQPQPVNVPPVQQGLMRLFQTTGDSRALIPKLESADEAYGVRYSLTNDQLSAGTKAFGTAVERRIAQLAKDPAFNQKNPQQQANQLSNEYADIRKTLQAVWVARELGVERTGIPLGVYRQALDGLLEQKDATGAAAFPRLTFEQKRTVLGRALERYQANLQGQTQ